MNSIQNIVLFAVVITYPKKHSPHADLLPHTFGVTPWNKKKKELVLIPLIFLSFFISSYFIYLFIYFFLTEPGFKLLGEKKWENAVTIILIIISWLISQEQEKSYLEKVVGEWSNNKWISSTQSMCSFVHKVLWKDCSQNEVDLSSLKTLLSLLT